MKPKPLTKEQILLAMRMTKSNKAASRYLNVSYIHYKMWAKRYYEFEGGRSLFEIHKNQAGKGIPKFLAGNPEKKSQWDVLDVIEGRIAAVHFRPEDIKKKMLDEGYLKEECAMCGFHDRRVSDYKMPLILNFKDNNPNHYNLGNIRFLCYNCHFLYVGDLFSEKQIRSKEDANAPLIKEEIDWQVDDNFLAHFQDLGLERKDDYQEGDEYVSRV